MSRGFFIDVLWSHSLSRLRTLPPPSPYFPSAPEAFALCGNQSTTHAKCEQISTFTVTVDSDFYKQLTELKYSCFFCMAPTESFQYLLNCALKLGWKERNYIHVVFVISMFPLYCSCCCARLCASPFKMTAIKLRKCACPSQKKKKINDRRRCELQLDGVIVCIELVQLFVGVK